MTRIGLVSLGCAKNLVDSEIILGMFDSPEFEITNNPKEADLIIVNTCGFIDSAKKESIDTIFEMASYGKKIAVVGCLAQRYYKELKAELKEADLIVPIRDYQELSVRLEELLGKKGIARFNPLIRRRSTKPFEAYLRISEGCDNFCAFCAIPLIRGRFKSRPFDEILVEAKKLKQDGVKEISLISQDTTVYGKDFVGGKPNICDLLRALEGMGFYSIRLLYLYPSEISDELIDLIASSKVIAHYFDIPVQTCSERMLRLMKRHCGEKETFALFDKIKARCPDAILRTTLIAGFSGETKRDHEKAIKMLEDIRFDHMGAFAYSVEEGTAGSILPHRVRESTKQKRLKELMLCQKKISYEQAKKHVGEVMEGLVIAKGKKQGEYMLRSYWNAPDDVDGAIYFTSPKLLEEGDIVKVRIASSSIYDLFGELAG